MAAKPQRAVIEIRATHRDAFGQAPGERLDGHAEQVLAYVFCVTYLDGKLHRVTRVGCQPRRGPAVTYLELTEAEIAALTPGKHLLAVEIRNPQVTVGLDVRLLSYTE